MRALSDVIRQLEEQYPQIYPRIASLAEAGRDSCSFCKKADADIVMSGHKRDCEWMKWRAHVEQLKREAARSSSEGGAHAQQR